MNPTLRKDADAIIASSLNAVLPAPRMLPAAMWMVTPSPH